MSDPLSGQWTNQLNCNVRMFQDASSKRWTENALLEMNTLASIHLADLNQEYVQLFVQI